MSFVKETYKKIFHIRDENHMDFYPEDKMAIDVIKDLQSQINRNLLETFWNDGVIKEQVRQEIKSDAFNKSYEAPDDNILLARQYIIHLKNQITKEKAKTQRFREEAIEAKKELSKLKRSK